MIRGLESMSLALINNHLKILQDRADMLARCRTFFAEKRVLEVDVPILSRSASVDTHIELIQASCCNQPAYLHSSPEYGMKRLLALGVNDIYQISHVFRDYEKGERHTPEFTMAEWYRIGMTLKEMIDETVQFILLFLEDLPLDYEIFTYEQAFWRWYGEFPSSLEERDALFAFEIEPHLGKNSLAVVSGFPVEHAALARIGNNGLAERFEVYYQGIELANGYHELIDPVEQSRRIDETNHARATLGKQMLPPDREFIEALEAGLPDCCGVAVGFDRLMMLRHKLEDIRNASSFFI